MLSPGGRTAWLRVLCGALWHNISIRPDCGQKEPNLSLLTLHNSVMGVCVCVWLWLWNNVWRPPQMTLFLSPGCITTLAKVGRSLESTIKKIKNTEKKYGHTLENVMRSLLSMYFLLTYRKSHTCTHNHSTTVHAVHARWHLCCVRSTQ